KSIFGKGQWSWLYKTKLDLIRKSGVICILDAALKERRLDVDSDDSSYSHIAGQDNGGTSQATTYVEKDLAREVEAANDLLYLLGATWREKALAPDYFQALHEMLWILGILAHEAVNSPADPSVGISDLRTEPRS